MGYVNTNNGGLMNKDERTEVTLFIKREDLITLTNYYERAVFNRIKFYYPPDEAVLQVAITDLALRIRKTGGTYVS